MDNQENYCQEGSINLYIYLFILINIDKDYHQILILYRNQHREGNFFIISGNILLKTLIKIRKRD